MLHGCPVGRSSLTMKSSVGDWHSALYIIITIKWQPPTFAYHFTVSQVLWCPFCNLTLWQYCDRGMIIILLLQIRNPCPMSSFLRYSDAKHQHSATPIPQLHKSLLNWFHASWLVGSIWIKVQEARSTVGLFFVVTFVSVYVSILIHLFIQQTNTEDQLFPVPGSA